MDKEFNEMIERFEPRYKSEIETVQKLGDQIGYGNMMSIASTLWAIHLEKDGIQSGAFVPTILSLMKKPEAERAKKERDSRVEHFKKMGFTAK